MICPPCNTPNREDAKFCRSCGHAFQKEAAKVETAQMNQDHLDLPKQGTTQWNEWRVKKHPDTEINLSEADLSMAGLSWANLDSALQLHF